MNLKVKDWLILSLLFDILMHVTTGWRQGMYAICTIVSGVAGLYCLFFNKRD